MLWGRMIINKFNRRNAMSLIELIVAIAIMSTVLISILTAMTAQLSMLSRGKEMTVGSFDNQSEVEKAIEYVESNDKFSSGDFKEILEYCKKLPNREDKEIGITGIGSGSVKLYMVSMLNDTKRTVVYLSPALASDEKYTVNLEAKNVDIFVNNDSTKKVALITGTPPKVTGKYTISGSNYYKSIYKWYASIPGIIEPQWPNDYEQIIRSVKDTELNKEATVELPDLKNYTNRYVMFSAQPTDGNGIRGTEVSSPKSVLIQGAEWRVGNFPWGDKNSNSVYDGFAVDKDVQLTYSMIDGNLDYNMLSVPIGDTGTTDIKNSSLFVPRELDGRNKYRSSIYGNVNTGNIYEKDIFTSKSIDWNVQKAIHFANKIISDNAPIKIKTTDGQIVMYRFVEIDSSGKPKLNAGVPKLKEPSAGFKFENMYNPNRKYTNLGSEISTLDDVYLGAYGIGKGFIYLHPFSSINAKNILLEAEEPITIYNSALALETLHGDDNTMNRQIILKSVKDISIKNNHGYTSSYIQGNSNTKSVIAFDTDKNISIENAIFKDIDINLLSNAVLKGVSWDFGNTLAVKDGKVLTLSKMPDGTKIKNEGNLYLGATGGLKFTDRIEEVLTKPVKIELNYPSADYSKIIINTVNYKRDLSMESGFEDIVEKGNWKNLGTSGSSLEYKIDLINNVANITSMKIKFDGHNELKLEVNKYNNSVNTKYKLYIRDKYIKDKDNNILEASIDGEI
ncbi:MAG: type II secretion system protein [Peptoanaerobacter stomatis]|uniref:type II secretion system protein n=1 Tax=Peptoanaerobacter stomatis TaxID=796937 RepID=UPI003FA02F0E